jgi:hypothetical protein
MRPTHIPKDFVNGTRIEDGPFQGIIAKPCFCGRQVQSGENAVLVGSNFGEFYLLHEEHCPAGIVGGEEDA